jgi:formylglycine-generating enzyme required for sulfatase activity
MKKYGILLMIVFFCSIPLYVESGENMVFIKGGCYQMGDTFGDAEKNDEPVHKGWKGGHQHHHLGVNEKPVHEVCVDDFYMAKYEVTVSEFREFVADIGYKTDAENGDGCFGWSGKKWEKDKNRNWRNPGFPQDDSHPVSCVSWDDAVVYIEWLSDKTGKRYRLPTEAEWEYTARSGGKKEKWAGTNNESGLSDYAWYNNNSNGKTHPVGQKKPNGFGLYDMTGNVWEWVQDWYGENYYSSSPKNNPQGPTSGFQHIHRGGSWYYSSHQARVTSRHPYTSDYRCYSLGIRLAASVK